MKKPSSQTLIGQKQLTWSSMYLENIELSKPKAKSEKNGL